MANAAYIYTDQLYKFDWRGSSDGGEYAQYCGDGNRGGGAGDGLTTIVCCDDDADDDDGVEDDVAPDDGDIGDAYE